MVDNLQNNVRKVVQATPQLEQLAGAVWPFIESNNSEIELWPNKKMFKTNTNNIFVYIQNRFNQLLQLNGMKAIAEA